MPDKELVTITLRHEGLGTRRPCVLCWCWTDKEPYHFTVPVKGGKAGIVCDECAGHPEDIPARMRAEAARMQTAAKHLEEDAAKYVFTTAITPVPPLPEDCPEEDRLYHADEKSWPDWMRERIGLPSLSDEYREKNIEAAKQQSRRPADA